MKKFKFIKNKIGGSLVEVIASMGILSILFLFFVNITILSVRMVDNSTRMSNRDCKAISGMENKISQNNEKDEDAKITESDDNMVISFSGGNDGKKVDIKSHGKISKSTDSKKQSSFFYYYTPKDTPSDNYKN